MLARIPLGRMGEPEEVASLICWLASEEMSFSTAACFDISGGARRTSVLKRLVEDALPRLEQREDTVHRERLEMLGLAVRLKAASSR